MGAGEGEILALTNHSLMILEKHFLGQFKYIFFKTNLLVEVNFNILSKSTTVDVSHCFGISKGFK